MAMKTTLVRSLAALAAVATLLVLAAPVLAQEAGEHGGPVPLERRVLAIGILIAFVALMVAWAWLYRRVNRA
jgi:divalent metal cation (Fe/Co/Zn/Cd) transporter